ncbi:mucin-associated surface protein (MASP), partial [Trypanosoma cruzi]
MAMMMTGRVLLVCALCVLWCGLCGVAADAGDYDVYCGCGVTFRLDEAQTEHWRRSCEWLFVARVAARNLSRRLVAGVMVAACRPVSGVVLRVPGKSTDGFLPSSCTCRRVSPA